MQCVTLMRPPVLNDDVVKSLRITPEQIDRVARSEGVELERRERRFRGDRPPLDVAGKTVIVVATPVAPPNTCERFRTEADEMVCLASPEPFVAVGCWYDEFMQVEDEEVVQVLRHVERDAA